MASLLFSSQPFSNTSQGFLQQPSITRDLMTKPTKINIRNSCPVDPSGQDNASKKNCHGSLEKFFKRDYKWASAEKIESFKIPKGLSEETIRSISSRRNEPDWLLDFRLNSYRMFLKMTDPKWSDNKYPRIDLQDICFYSEPVKKPSEKNLQQGNYFGGDGMANVVVLDSVSIDTTERKKLENLEKAGVIFCPISKAIKEYPDLVRKYLGRVVPSNDNYYATLNSAVFSDGSFCYIPKSTTCPQTLSTYFRINAPEIGQFERTLIVADEGSYVEYYEGCTAASHDSNQLHAAVVELHCSKDAEIKYRTLQNWDSGDKQGRGGIYNFVTKRGICAGSRSKISWVQVERGSAITWKYPSVVLEGNDSIGEFYSVALTSDHQQADTGTKMIHKGKNTRSRIISKGIAAGQSKNVYRGVVHVFSGADNASNSSQCDSMLIGDNAAANTYPYMQVSNYTACIQHEASTSKIETEKIFYFQQRGLDYETAMTTMISGFCKDVFNELPLEYGTEVKELMSLKLEGSIG